MPVVSARRVCGDLAARQKGVVSRAQLVAVGLTSTVITGLIGDRYLNPLHRGVYAVGHLALPNFAREQAALLACGESAALTGRSALYVWGLVDAPPATVEVTVPHSRRRKRPGIRLHLVRAIQPRELRRHHGLDVIFPAGALIHFAAEAAPDELGDAVAEARIKNRIRKGELEAAVQAAGRRRGAAQMRAFLRNEGEPTITRSRAERRFRRLLRAARLPQPKVNARIAGLEVDFLWPEHKVVLEIDGWQFHGHRRAFERDRKKDMILSDAGYHVIRITVRQFTQEPLALMAHIARVLDRRGRNHH